MRPPAASPALVAPALAFAQLWNALADVLGTAATSTLLRRAIRRASVQAPELADVAVLREGLAYRYELPASWAEPAARPTSGDTGPARALHELVRELVPLLSELTGRVVVARLGRLTALRDGAMVTEEDLAQWSTVKK